MDESQIDSMLEEVNQALETIANKYFVSTWVIGLAVRDDKGTHSLFTYDGSHPEALGLACLMEQDLRVDRAVRREGDSNDPE